MPSTNEKNNYPFNFLCLNCGKRYGCFYIDIPCPVCGEIDREVLPLSLACPLKNIYSKKHGDKK